MRPVSLARMAIAALVAGAVPPLLAQESPNIHYGMVTHYVDARMADKMRELGAGIARVDFNWSGMEPARSRRYDFDYTDTSVRSARRRGLEVFATIGYTPKWSNGGRNEHAPPLRIQDWEDFVTTVVERYQGRDMDVKYFGIWNEPDLPGFFEGRLDDYIALVTAGRRAIRRADCETRPRVRAGASPLRGHGAGLAGQESQQGSTRPGWVSQRHLGIHAWDYGLGEKK